ncbi:uncharacterized protein LOC110458631 [Mizuhopecten yessoensis]|uniref:uncharacterized protein LOC110458631 n=1 Tax=Mizuhopecten yessoensis TaxID=6573 RepID=UPI000B45A3A0|nr:uncharacterized protein LOC110458631 [Mizuhopecten yessoensis]
METAIAKSIFEDASSVHGGLRQVTLSDYDIIIGAVNENNDHWTLCAVYPKEKIIFYVNPLGESKPRMDKFLMHWRRFLLQRYNTGLDSPPMSAQWKIERKCHIKQYDSVSCGVYVLKFAEHFVWAQSLNFRSARNELVEIRLGIAKQLLEISEPLESYCRECCFTETAETIWIQCDSCPKWFHKSCLDIPEHNNIIDIQTNPYLCKFCLKDYETENTDQPKKRNTYQLRLNPQQKRKRSSFVYDAVKKIKLDNIYKSGKGEKNDIEKWERNMEIPVLPLEKVPPLIWPEDMDDDVEDISDDEEKEGGFGKISMGEIEETIGKLYSTIPLLAAGKVMSPYHDNFVKGIFKPTCGYGLTEFKSQTYVALEVWITKTFLKNVRKDIFTNWTTVRGAGKELLARFKESSIYGEQYVKHVIMKEIITRIVMDIRNISWEEAARICSATESCS